MWSLLLIAVAAWRFAHSSGSRQRVLVAPVVVAGCTYLALTAAIHGVSLDRGFVRERRARAPALAGSGCHTCGASGRCCLGPASGSPHPLVPGPARGRAGRVGSRRGACERRSPGHLPIRCSGLPTPWARAGSRTPRPLDRSTLRRLREGPRRPFCGTVKLSPISSTAPVSSTTRNSSWTSRRPPALRSRTSACRPSAYTARRPPLLPRPHHRGGGCGASPAGARPPRRCRTSASSEYPLALRLLRPFFPEPIRIIKSRGTPPRSGCRTGPGDCRATR